MPNHWIAISDIAPEGREFLFDDQAIWQDGVKEFGLPVEPAGDIVATATIQPQGEDAALVRGTLAGRVKLPCDRCAEPYEFAFEEAFDAFEQLPDGEADETPRMREENGQLQLDIGAILWEEFALALPVKPLCAEGCQGVCPGCGKDLNQGECDCEQDEGDERLAVFRNLKIK